MQPAESHVLRHRISIFLLNSPPFCSQEFPGGLSSLPFYLKTKLFALWPTAFAKICKSNVGRAHQMFLEFWEACYNQSTRNSFSSESARAENSLRCGNSTASSERMVQDRERTGFWWRGNFRSKFCNWKWTWTIQFVSRQKEIRICEYLTEKKIFQRA